MLPFLFMSLRPTWMSVFKHRAQLLQKHLTATRQAFFDSSSDHAQVLWLIASR